jgi:hypothetical protein
MIAAISIGGLVPLFLQILIVGAICWLLWWLIGFINPPEPFKKVLQVFVAVVGVIFLINALLSLGGKAFIEW